MPRKPKPAAPGSPLDVESMIRVDHAGEYGAVRIYEGQLAVLKRRKGAAASVETINFGNPHGSTRMAAVAIAVPAEPPSETTP